MFIDAALTEGSENLLLEVTNPSTGSTVDSIARGCSSDVDKAVSSCRRAHAEGRWRSLSPSTRRQVLARFAELILAEAPMLDALDAEDMGKPISLRLFDAATAAGFMRYCAEVASSINGDILASDEGSYVTQRWAPRGVVAAVVPWNFPTYIAVLKLAAALAGGNCVVLKPSEMSTRSAIRLAQLGIKAGLPAGVFNVVPGLGETVGCALGLHPDVDMVSFTGSTEVGKLMVQYAGQSNLKKVIAECGGKSPQIVFDDGVDLDAAADFIAGLLLSNQGQVCSVGSRIIVQRSIEQALVDRLVHRMRGVTIGDACDPATTFGPLASARQLQRVMGFIEGASGEGAELVTGGGRVLEETGGYFAAPTLFRNVDPNSRIAQEEVFGPVLSVIPFDKEEDAIRIANGTRYGLVAYVWTADLARGMRMKSIDSSVWIYSGRPTGEGAGHGTSIEPYGQSGTGVEGGIAGIQGYMRRQTLAYHYG